jgi:hypothetical protein
MSLKCNICSISDEISDWFKLESSPIRLPVSPPDDRPAFLVVSGSPPPKTSRRPLTDQYC